MSAQNIRRRRIDSLVDLVLQSNCLVSLHLQLIDLMMQIFNKASMSFQLSLRDA